jgi:cellulase/cellobiase CelA1
LAIEEALGQLQQLTCLGFNSIHDIGAAMATASSLSQLQELQLSNSGTPEQPLQMQWLPSSLTSVMLAACAVSCAAGSSSSSSSSSGGSSSWQLPVLEQLELTKSVGGFEPALLKQMPKLRVFRYYPTEGEGAFYDGPPSHLEQQLLELLPQLQHLQLDCLVHWPSPSSCASLTASSQLTALLLMECRLPKGAVQHMFAAGQQLQCIEAVASDVYQVDVNHQWSEPQYTARLLRRGSLIVGPSDLAKLASCCPRLRDLKMIWCDLPGPGSGEGTLEAAPLLQLTALQVAGRYWDDRTAEKVLAHMTGEVNSSHSLDINMQSAVEAHPLHA